MFPSRPQLPFRFSRRLATALAIGGLASLGSLPSALAAELTVTIEPVSAEGNLMVALYDSAEEFRKRPRAAQRHAAGTAPVRFRFDQLPAGDYAIAVYQDLNGNGQLDTNMVGMPREPFGFSQEPKGLMGPPAWDQVKFAVPNEGTAIDVRLGK